MKSEEGTILVECDVCRHVVPEVYTSTCYGHDHTVCLVCLLKEKQQSTLCGGYFIEPAPS